MKFDSKIIISVFILTLFAVLVTYTHIKNDRKLSSANNKPISEEAVSVAHSTTSKIILPPDPGELGIATLEGIDADGDGVRDDIQRYIFLTYEDSNTRLALMQEARAIQKYLLNANNKERVTMISHELRDADTCLTYVRGMLIEDSDALIQDLITMRKRLDIIFNTPLRKEALEVARKQTDALTYYPASTESERRSRCNFDLTVRAFLWRFERYVAKPCISLLRETQELQDSLLERIQRRQVAM